MKRLNYLVSVACCAIGLTVGFVVGTKQNSKSLVSRAAEIIYIREPNEEDRGCDFGTYTTYAITEGARAGGRVTVCNYWGEVGEKITVRVYE